ncbi:MotA/TolQ/ExbB proton channel family protein [Gimesia sp.]|uniref:MotA/TolQ/ExbB proton channel family protein n=1 Tax=Gimesia sp. TaxID=2024833 RepID=UPI000C4A8D3C|nr:MotA/TolQ/ExbB proton channel family protein [Gimesia sp.]MAX36836.1 biopolymer transporter ExbB [Gimesia sp.]HBL42148.1 biopolymer transporter ExbB [Planctomycetaceae bacterium]|tara:strand:+ start:5312 stop:6280 length:969 start_codon:yes stop_codon:yes gene_type:complete
MIKLNSNQQSPTGSPANTQRGFRLRFLAKLLVICGLCLILSPDNSAAQERLPKVVESVNGEFVEVKDPAGPLPGSGLQPERGTKIPFTPQEIIEELKYYILPFVIASVISMWFIIERLVILRSGRVIPRHFVTRFLKLLQDGKLNSRSALKLCDENPSPISAVFAHGVRKWGKPSVEVEQAIIDGGERQLSQLRKHLRVINGVATVAPLMGLLGTVVGMILAFNDIANSSAMGKAEELAGGIALALLTTALGLGIAIPSLIMYMYLAGRVDGLVMEMDQSAQDLVHLISAEGLAASAASRKSSSSAPATSTKAKPDKTTSAS